MTMSNVNILMAVLCAVIGLCVAPTSAALFDGCDYTYNINAGYSYVESPYYPNNYPSGTSCRYQMVAPIDYEIVINCTMVIPKNADSCSTEYFYLARDGDKLLRGSEQFCGTGQFIRKSIFRQATLAYVSYSNNLSGRFRCSLYAQPQPCDCGWSVSSKIANGVEAGVNEYPSMAALKDTTSNLASFCGAEIISHRHLVTAAHCTRIQPVATNIRALVGDHNLASTTETQYAATYAISQIIEHSGYTADPVANDIAVLVTAQNIEWSRGVGPICLPPPANVYDTFAYEYVDVIGWGTKGFSAPTSNTLQKVTVMLIDNNSCQQSFQGVAPITTSQVCTYDYSGTNRDSCQYDSGGPVILKRSRQFLVGTISFGKVCGTGTYPIGVNTRITSYLTWIYQQTAYTTCTVSM